MLTLLSLTGTEPVTLAEAKLAARVDNDLGSTSSLDSYITAAITAARERAELITGRSYRQKVLREQLVDWPAADEPIHVFAPSAVAISYWNGSAWVNLSSAAFAFFPLEPGGTGIAPAYGSSWPTLGPIAGGPRVRVDLTVPPNTVGGEVLTPESVKLFIKAMVAGWVNNGDALISGQFSSNPLLDGMLDSERLWA